MNFIIKVSRSQNLIIKKEYNAILVIIDKPTKQSYIVALKKNIQQNNKEILYSERQYSIIEYKIEYYSTQKKVYSKITKNYYTPKPSIVL